MSLSHRPAAYVTASALALSLACRGGADVSYDRSTPRATVESFFQALRAHRIPADLNLFFTDPVEVDMWTFRCRDDDCAGGDIRSLNVEMRSELSAVAHLGFAVVSKNGGQVLAGKDLELLLTKEGASWMIARFGPRIPAPAPTPPPASTDRADAGGD